ncbi:MAG: HIT family protein [Clostridia bacterium]|nr:HIT family protein [Clostridia bacterium]
MKKDDCLFCKIANGDIPSKTIYEDQKFRVFLDISPATRGHALIVPKDHYADLFEISEETVKDAIALAKKIASVMKERLHCEGINIVQNNGEVAGQSVFHFHMHLIPRYSDDHQNILWNPTNPDDAALEEIKNILKQ